MRVERRPVVEADEPFLRELYATTRPDLAGFDDAIREQFVDLQLRAQRTGWEVSFPGAEHELILVGGVPVGRVWVAWPPGECRVVDIALLPEHRRCGIGSQVYGEIIAEADRRGVPVRTNVERTNGPSLAFHASLGFEPAGGDEVYLGMIRV